MEVDHTYTSVTYKTSFMLEKFTHTAMVYHLEVMFENFKLTKTVHKSDHYIS